MFLFQETPLQVVAGHHLYTTDSNRKTGSTLRVLNETAYF